MWSKITAYVKDLASQEPAVVAWAVNGGLALLHPDRHALANESRRKQRRHRGCEKGLRVRVVLRHEARLSWAGLASR